jgi:hypothetical protein
MPRSFGAGSALGAGAAKAPDKVTALRMREEKRILAEDMMNQWYERNGYEYALLTIYKRLHMTFKATFSLTRKTQTVN